MKGWCLEPSCKFYDTWPIAFKVFQFMSTHFYYTLDFIIAFFFVFVCLGHVFVLHVVICARMFDAPHDNNGSDIIARRSCAHLKTDVTFEKNICPGTVVACVVCFFKYL